MYARSLGVQLLLAFGCAVLAAPALGKTARSVHRRRWSRDRRRPCPSPAR